MFVELNCENLFDCSHDSLKQDEEFTPEGTRHWTQTRYWQKLNHIGQAILSCSRELPDLVALCEVENDSVVRDLTRRSLLRNAGYSYLMTCSPDVRGLDVALLYQPASFRPLCYEEIEVPPMKNMRPTRHILYIKGIDAAADTLHLFVVHAPSRYGGERQTRPFRRRFVEVLLAALQPVQNQRVIVAGDFNDYDDSPSLKMLEDGGLVNVSARATGQHGVARGTYRFRGEWHSLDHVLVSSQLRPCVRQVYINDASFLLEEEPVYGGSRPHRTYQGYRYQRGYSDHLPLVVELSSGY